VIYILIDYYPQKKMYLFKFSCLNIALLLLNYVSGSLKILNRYFGVKKIYIKHIYTFIGECKY
jgi:hypothetical protein